MIMKLLLGRGVCRYACIILVVLIFHLCNENTRADAGFDVCKDAFAISNAPGYCFAIASFSRWYYLNRNGGPCLREIMDKKTQQVLAKDLQGFYSKNLVGVQADYCNKYQGNQNASTRRFLGNLASGNPSIVLLMNKGPRGVVLHAVLAYAWVPEKNLIKIYDPNYLNRERHIDLGKSTYTSLDITYHAICFPEVLNDHPELTKKIVALYAQHVESRIARNSAAWRKAAATPSDGPSKREGYSRGPTK